VFSHREEEYQEGEKGGEASSKGNQEKDRKGTAWWGDKQRQQNEECQEGQATREDKEKSGKKEGKRWRSRLDVDHQGKKEDPSRRR